MRVGFTERVNCLQFMSEDGRETAVQMSLGTSFHKVGASNAKLSLKCIFDLCTEDRSVEY